ncbi:MAG: hypothetical protein L3J62_06410 [Gammaproteobacteria bacterium]|nr:hypothetical protein [Gammaproteobacteria bacterium]MCF6230411.1 hypothetical protein [Gammaproteobacteria bacterium]
MSFIENLQKTLGDESTGSSGSLELNPESLVTLLSSIMGKHLSELHGDVIDFSFLLRPFYNLYVYIYANGSYLEPVINDHTDEQFAFNNINGLSETEFNGKVHRLIYGLSKSNDVHASISSILTSEIKEVARVDMATLSELLSDECDKRQVGVSLSFTAIERMILKCRLRGNIKFVKIQKSSHAPVEIDSEMRLTMLNSLSDHMGAKQLPEKKYKLLLSSVLFMPTYFLEQFSSGYLNAKQHARGLKALICGIEFQHKPVQAILLAILKARNIPLIGSQHGGFYGQTDPTWLERTEREIFDYYITWGYKFSDNDHPLPSVRLSRKRLGDLLSVTKSHFLQSKSKTVLVVLPHIMPTLAYSIQSPRVTQQQQALHRSLMMLESLVDVGYEITLRAHPRNPFSDYEAAIPDQLKGAVVVCSGQTGSLVEVMPEYEWVFFTNPNATGLSECVANGIEFRIVSDPCDYQIRPEASKVYQSLQSSKVWFTSKIELHHLDKESGKGERSKAIDQFMKMYGLHSKSYLQDWISYINMLKLG